MAIIEKLKTPDQITLDGTGTPLPLGNAETEHTWAIYRFFNASTDIELVAPGDDTGWPVPAGEDVSYGPIKIKGEDAYTELRGPQGTTVELEIAITDGAGGGEIGGPISDEVDIDEVNVDLGQSKEAADSVQKMRPTNSTIIGVKPQDHGVTADQCTAWIQNRGSASVYKRPNNTQEQSGVEIVAKNHAIVPDIVSDNDEIFIYFPDSAGGEVDVFFYGG